MAGVATSGAPVFSLDAVGKIMLQLLLPFVAGQLLRPWIGKWVGRHNRLLKVVDQGSILLVVYTAFSEAVIGGLWANTPIMALVALLAISIVLLCCVRSEEPTSELQSLIRSSYAVFCLKKQNY